MEHSAKMASIEILHAHLVGEGDWRALNYVVQDEKELQTGLLGPGGEVVLRIPYEDGATAEQLGAAWVAAWTQFKESL